MTATDSGSRRERSTQNNLQSDLEEVREKSEEKERGKGDTYKKDPCSKATKKKVGRDEKRPRKTKQKSDLRCRDSNPVPEREKLIF